MKRKLKLALASVCVVAAGFGGMKAYNAANQSEADLLLAENVEALSGGEGASSGTRIKCYTSFTYEAGALVVDCKTCTTISNHTDKWCNIHDYCVG